MSDKIASNNQMININQQVTIKLFNHKSVSKT